ncbi:unnamed protein product [Thlaspi arvense]|uniref:Uncharacterized protein n=1 Tax=Thlaspi arvense TaxID=13288 RepID=A0AAU9T8X6_THLAR|nr:unnamed protein product [Thlaspi arvense]
MDLRDKPALEKLFASEKHLSYVHIQYYLPIVIDFSLTLELKANQVSFCKLVFDLSYRSWALHILFHSSIKISANNLDSEVQEENSLAEAMAAPGCLLSCWPRRICSGSRTESCIGSW